MRLLPLTRVLNRNVPMTTNRDFTDVPLMRRPYASMPVYQQQYVGGVATQVDSTTVEIDLTILKPYGIYTVRFVLWYNHTGDDITFV
jgi:hypothetical protein